MHGVPCIQTAALHPGFTHTIDGKRDTQSRLDYLFVKGSTHADLPAGAQQSRTACTVASSSAVDGATAASRGPQPTHPTCAYTAPAQPA